jgi:hypothetical protein
MPYKNFQPQQLTASEVNTYLMNQSVMVFANSAARSAALTLPTEGMVTYLQDTDELEIYNGSAWLRAVVTSDDESISTSGNITSSAGNIAATTGNLTAGGSATITGGLTVDTSSLRVDATNDVVGIMTATPATGQYNDWSVDIASGRVRIGGQRSGGTAGITLGTGTPTANWYNEAAFIGLDGAANSSNVGFWHSGAWRQLIAQTGQTVFPYQPYFHGRNGSGNLTFTGVWNPATVFVNNQSRYNTSNGRFTPGVAGYVLCAFASLINTPLNNSHFYVYFNVDGAEKTVRVHTDYAQPRSYEPVTNVAIVYVPTASSYVECLVHCQESAAIYGSPWGGGLTYALLG